MDAKKGALIVIGVMAAVVILAVATQYAPGGTNSATATPVPMLTRESCEAARGHWNECGSACRGQPEGTICTLQCVPMCMCGGIAGFGCPQGFTCTDYLPSPTTPDAMGVCRKQ
jgi:hypothetical protein